jgi:hypothetical protein
MESSLVRCFQASQRCVYDGELEILAKEKIRENSRKRSWRAVLKAFPFLGAGGIFPTFWPFLVRRWKSLNRSR